MRKQRFWKRNTKENTWETFLNDIEIEKLKLEFSKLIFFDFPKTLKHMRRCRFWGPKTYLKTQLNVRKIALENSLKSSQKPRYIGPKTNLRLKTLARLALRSIGQLTAQWLYFLLLWVAGRPPSRPSKIRELCRISRSNFTAVNRPVDRALVH